MTYQQIKSFINTYIVQNGVNAITGSQLNTALNELADYKGFDSVVVTTLPAGSDATATVQGMTLVLGIPKGADGRDGIDGQDAVNPFKGWFTTDNIPTTGQEGDYCNVSDTSVTPHTVTIYRWSTAQNAFVDTGEVPDTATGETFASSETLQEVAIDDSHLVNPVNTADPNKPVLADARDVAPIKKKLEILTQDWVDLDLTNYPLIFDKNYIDCRESQTGIPKISSSSSTSSKLIIVDVEGYKKVKFLGRIYNNSSTPASGWAFYDSTNYDPTAPASTTNSGFLKDNTGHIENGYSLYDKGTQSSDATKEYEVDVPANAKYLKLMCSMNNSALTLNNFYFKFSGETIHSMVEDAAFATSEKLKSTSIANDVLENDNGLVRSSAVWIDNAKKYAQTFEKIGLSVGYYARNSGNKQTSGDVYQKFLCTSKIVIKGQSLYVSLADGTATDIRVLFWQQNGNYLGQDYSVLLNNQLIIGVPAGAYSCAFNVCISEFQTNTVYTQEQANGMLFYGGDSISDMISKQMSQSGFAILENDTIANRNISCADIVFGENPRLLLTGASFAYNNGAIGWTNSIANNSLNAWFELACRDMQIAGINKAVSGSSITNAANMAYKGTLWSMNSNDKNYIDAFDALVIMHVLNYDVMNTSLIRGTVEDYEANPDPNATNGNLFYVDDDITSPSYHGDRSSATIARSYDYLIKKYIKDCLSRKDVEGSAYHGKRHGKPVQIIMCTSWHDDRTTFNNSIRKLAASWGFPLVQFDANIGFTKNKPLSNGDQVSTIYSHGDTESIGGVVYGWHPMRVADLTENSESLQEIPYIQLKMAKIFENSFK